MSTGWVDPDRLRGVMEDVERWRAGSRNQRETAIRQQMERQASVERMRGVLPADDGLFGKDATGGGASAGAETWDRPAVFAHLNHGGSTDGLPAEFVSDWERNKKDSWLT